MIPWEHLITFTALYGGLYMGGHTVKATARAIGVLSEEAVLEVFVSKESGTWTVLVTDPQGLSCVLAAGQAWQETPQATDQPEPNGDSGHGALVKLSPSPPL